MGTDNLNEVLTFTFGDIFGTNKKRGFKKISFEQYFKDVGGERCHALEEHYDIKLPQRATSGSAGYDIHSPISFQLNPGETMKVPTGIKSYMLENEVLKIYIRSSIGFKYNVVLCNSTGIVDSDYQYAQNDGHIWIKLINHGDEVLEINKGDAIAQGIFENYLLTDDDKPVSENRVGGIGSTDATIIEEGE